MKYRAFLCSLTVNFLNMDEYVQHVKKKKTHTTDMRSETYPSIIIICIFYGALKKSNVNIFIRNYVQFNFKMFRWYHANTTVIIELVHELF